MSSPPKSERRPLDVPTQAHTGSLLLHFLKSDGTLQPPRPDSRIKQGAGPTIYGPTWAGVKRGYLGLWVEDRPLESLALMSSTSISCSNIFSIF